MRFDLDKVFGIHQQGVRLRAQRAELLASNLANADTPNYKARDIDFKQVLQQTETAASAANMRTTNAKHLQSNGFDNVFGNGMNAELMYRNPLQPSVDGNTVDTQHEKSQFIQNAVQYQVSLSFLSGKIKSLMTALKGE
jgi:flagellar basal-body rod protein FlgB